MGQAPMKATREFFAYRATGKDQAPLQIPLERNEM